MTIDKDVWAGLFFMGLAALGLYIGADYPFGTPARMGAGFLPKLLCWAMLSLGALVTLTGLVRRGEPMDAWAVGPLLAILDAVLLFGAALEGPGLEIAILGAVLIGGTAAPLPNRFEHWLLLLVAALLSLYLWPGATAKLTAWTGITALPAVLIGLSVAAVAVVILSHARRVPLATMLERVLLGVLLGMACIIVFVDGLGLTMKSAVVMDVWGGIKSTVIRPVILLVRSLTGI